MVANAVNKISADFHAVEAGAMDIKNQAQSIMTMLDDFKSDVLKFVQDNWEEGAASEAFQELQKMWNQHAAQLNDTLNGAAQLVSTGNAELQGTDTALAGLF
ncbi:MULTISPECIES: WXG100 family type VII secretion target [Nocardia]|uniref:WXG100 family type VII secretion target n=1 Tax=Nocardia TaxID=1817 RepID=UPI0007A5613B|nr:WXG100 family type VII secretion target [Nocardia anaemiae]